MTPEECASIRSIARWVLPVLVGPSTAVTPAPGARSWPNEEEKAIFYRCFFLLEAFVIASQRVGAKRRPMTGSAKPSIWPRRKMDCFVASLLAMTGKPSTHLSFGTICADLFHNATHSRSRLNFWNESGTNRARIGDSYALRLRSPQHLALTLRMRH